MKKLKLFMVAIVLGLCLSIVPISPFNHSTYVSASTIKLNKSKISVYTDNKYTLKINGTSAKVTWSSSNKTIASVSSKGIIKGIKKGTAVITATVSTKKYTCNVTVKNPDLNETSLELEIGEADKLVINGIKDDVLWQSTSDSKVSVNDNGMIYAYKLGTVNITGRVNGKTYTCKVSVVERRLHASVKSLTCSQETTIAITVDDVTENDDLSMITDDSDFIDYEWGGWKVNATSIIITPIKSGITNLTVSLNDDEEIVIPITIVDSKRTNAKLLTAEEVYKECSEATVQINTDIAIGSGFFIDYGKIVTNYHVIEGASEIEVQLKNGVSYTVEYILGYNKDLDIAILSIPVETDILPINNKGVNVGETVYAIGSPLGLSDTFTNGIVSNISRHQDKLDLIQTNAAITHGNSGGPLINAYGEVIGINSLGIEEGQNLNFAIDIKQIFSVSVSHHMTVKEYAKLNISVGDTEDTPSKGSESNILYEDSNISGWYNKCQTITSDTFVYGTAEPEGGDVYRFTLYETTIVSVVGSATTNDADSLLLYFAISNSNDTELVVSTTEFSDGYLFRSFSYTLEPGTYYVKACTYLNSTTNSIPYSFYFL